MAKLHTTRESIRSFQPKERNGLRHEELVTAVCNYHCRGFTASDIQRVIGERFRIKLTREEPYRLVAHGASRGWIKFSPPGSLELADQLQDSYRWLQDISVVRTAVSDDVALHMARMLFQQVCLLAHERGPEAVVRVGFAGGGALRKTARVFAEMLKEPQANLPKRIVFHAMVAGFNVSDPTNDPNAFFTFFAGEKELQVETSFFGLHVPGIVATKRIKALQALPGIREAYARAKDIDIIVTSCAGHWQRGHGALYHWYGEVSKSARDKLTKAGCIGDMMWRPMSESGPLEIPTDIRAVTLMELSHLPAFIKRGRQVMLLVGPCGFCTEPKDEVLRAILNSEQQLITHLCVDSRSARGVFKNGGFGH